MKEDIIFSLFSKAVAQKQLRKILEPRLNKAIYKAIVVNGKKYPQPINIKVYQYLSAMMRSVFKNLDKGYISKHVIQKVVSTLLKNAFLKDSFVTTLPNEFEKKYGIKPPSLIVLAPTQLCNLNCIGCYAASNAKTSAKLPYEVVDKIVNEVRYQWGVPFVVISGGEPFMYKDDGKSMLDIYEKYKDVFFLSFTNGTLITPELAERMAKLGNITPAISVEGFEKETDERRGKGVFQKILKAFENLRNVGVPFGISVTGTMKNIETLLKDDFYNFFFNEQGASYMWLFQFFPIGRGESDMDLMIIPGKRVELYRQWEKMLIDKKYCIADFWNSGMLSEGCIAYGREGGYLYIDWNGNIAPCNFAPYYVDNIKELYKNGKSLTDALFSDLFKNGRKWQCDYGLGKYEKPDNWLMPCSIRDHYKNFRENILTKDAKPLDKYAGEALQSKKYYDTMVKYDEELKKLAEKIWEEEYLKKKL